MKPTQFARPRGIRHFCRSAHAGALCGLLALGGPASASLIVNGGFEAPGLPAGGFQTYATGASFGGWTVVGAAGTVGPVSDTYTLGGLSFPAREGDQFVDLTGLSNTATGIEQVVATSAGDIYDLSFWVGNMVNPGGLFGLTSTVELFVEGVSQGTFTNANGTGSNALDWQQYAISFTAVDASTSIRFLNRDGATDNVNGLDDVVLAARVAAVPEPGSSTLVAAGLLALVLAARRTRAEPAPDRGRRCRRSMPGTARTV